MALLAVEFYKELDKERHYTIVIRDKLNTVRSVLTKLVTEPIRIISMEK